MRGNPQLRAARLDTSIARGDLRQARTYRFNPELAVVSPGRYADGSASPRELSVTQEFEWAGQRGLRIGAAELGLARAASTVEDAVRRTVGDASLSYYRALAAERRSTLAIQALDLTERLISAVRTQLREGEVSSLEANLAETEAGRARGRVLAEQRAANSALLELRFAIGVALDRPLRLFEDSLAATRLTPADADSLVAVALTRRPDLQARSVAVREATRLTALARRESIPNIRIGAIGERDRTVGDSRLGFTIGVGVPLLNRNQGLIARRRAETEQYTLAAQAATLTVRTEVVDALQSYMTATDEVAIYETSVLGPARRNTALLEVAYRAGKVALPTLLLLRNQLVDAELNYWDAWLAQHQAAVRLSVATATLPTDNVPTRTP